MNAQTQHTLGPWTIAGQVGDNHGYCETRHIYGRDGNTNCVANVKGSLANATFIVTACNAHDELVAALREIAEDDSVFDKAARFQSIARAALAKDGAA